MAEHSGSSKVIYRMIEKKMSLVQAKLNRVEIGMETARNANNLQLLAFNVRQGFNAALLKGLYLIKQGKSAKLELNQAISFYVLNSHLGGEEDIGLPFERINIINYLIEGDKIEIERFHSDAPDVALDYLLGEALYGVDVNERWTQALGLLTGNKEASLAVETYKNYWNILNKDIGDDVSLNSLKHLGIELFRKRKRDSFFSGAEQSEGGSEDNDYVVDYRLQAVLKSRGVVS